MEDIQNMIQVSITEAFAVRDGKEKEGNFATSMPMAPVAGGYLVGTGTIPPPVWQIYVSIRAEFKPVMGTRLAYWSERLQYFVQLNYPWPAILEYIIAYYQTYQDRTDLDAWFKPDSTLINYHFTLVQQKTHGPTCPVRACQCYTYA